jgi:hypothetical protein
MPTLPVLSDANHRDAIERELQWLLEAQPIWSSGINDDCVPLIKICNGSVTEIADYLANEWAWHGAPKRLGRRFESLLTALFEQSECIKLLGHGIVVKNQKQTIGELDYLIRLPDQIIHLEVAIKFYAGIGNSMDRSNTSSWIGPSCQDRLDLKINHITTHQLTLSQTTLGRQSITDEGLNQPDASLGLIFGYLIEPWADVGHFPMGFSASAPAYWAIHQEAHAAMRHLSRPYSTDYGWTRLERDQWIAPYVGKAELPLVIKSLDQPAQADCYALTSRRELTIEKLRLFVMHDDYANEAYKTMRESYSTQ